MTPPVSRHGAGLTTRVREAMAESHRESVPLKVGSSSPLEAMLIAQASHSSSSPGCEPFACGRARHLTEVEPVPRRANALLYETAYETAGIVAMVAEVFSLPVEIPAELHAGLVAARERLDAARRPSE